MNIAKDNSWISYALGAINENLPTDFRAYKNCLTDSKNAEMVPGTFLAPFGFTRFDESLAALYRE